ncbi:MAG: large conductance mechanosensitive channel protein MscL, partial [Clostridia bacterium]|nr:large conductance mechanosensitive channel protein MscL [Clostridia bacterium]
MKKFFGEFKKFITRGNVLDMSVGVIVGGAFTGIVNGLSNFILKPIINWLLALVLGAKGLEGAVTILSKATTPDGAIDLANSIYIDWGAFISAIINFLLIALVLFTIVRTINRVSEGNTRFMKKLQKGWLPKGDRKELKKLGIKLYEEDKVK